MLYGITVLQLENGVCGLPKCSQFKHSLIVLTTRKRGVIDFEDGS